MLNAKMTDELRRIGKGEWERFNALHEKVRDDKYLRPDYIMILRDFQELVIIWYVLNPKYMQLCLN